VPKKGSISIGLGSPDLAVATAGVAGVVAFFSAGFLTKKKSGNKTAARLGVSKGEQLEL